MPIYEYRCDACGHEHEAIRKFSDPPLMVCPACGKETLVKKVSAAGFQLKGSGWYQTDFRGGNKPSPAAKSDATDGKPAADGAATPSTSSATAETSASASETKAAPATAAPAPAATPRPT